MSNGRIENDAGLEQQVKWRNSIHRTEKKARKIWSVVDFGSQCVKNAI